MVEVVLPLPPKTLSSNCTHTARHKASDIKKYRADVGMALLAQKQELYRAGLLTPEVKKRVRCTWFLCRRPGDDYSYYPQDLSNADHAFKAGYDAIADVGVIKTDGKKYLEHLPTILLTTKVEHCGHTKVVLTIEIAQII